MLANAENVQAHPIRNLNLFEQIVHALTGLSVAPVAGSEMAAANCRSQSAFMSLFLSEPLGALANFLQYHFKTSHFFRRRIAKHVSNFRGMFPKHRRDQLLAL